MWRSMVKIGAATAVFGMLHSLLASRRAKDTAEALFGERNRNGWYRVFYLGQSLVSFTLLARYIRSQPGRELYQIKGPLALLMHAGQGAGIGFAIAAAHQVGIRRILGWESVCAWFQEESVPAEPEAQGPALDDEGRIRAAGPFACSRHPLNLAPLPVFWLWPRMTTNLLAFNSAATLYLVIGSLHEESRLRAEYGEVYAEYQNSDVPYYFPRLTLMAKDRMETVLEHSHPPEM